MANPSIDPSPAGLRNPKRFADPALKVGSMVSGASGALTSTRVASLTVIPPNPVATQS
jgi:hypothetical protein